jgi:hypothetical protein
MAGCEDCPAEKVSCLFFDFDRFDGAGLGGFAAGILEFLGDILFETADRQFILHLKDIRADIGTALTADAEILNDFGFHFPSFFQHRVADSRAAAGKDRKNGTRRCLWMMYPGKVNFFLLLFSMVSGRRNLDM